MSTLQDILEASSVPVYRLAYKGPTTAPAQYIVWMEYLEQCELYADNSEQETFHYYHINVFSKVNFEDLVSNIKTNLELNGYIRRDERDGPYVDGSGYYNRILRYRKD